MNDAYEIEREQAWANWYAHVNEQHDEMIAWLKEEFPNVARTWTWHDTSDCVSRIER